MWGNPQKQSKNAGSTDFRFLTSRPARGAEFSGISAPRAPEFSVLEGSRNSGPDRSPDLDFWAPGPATPRGQRLGGPRGPWTGFGPQNPKQGSLKLPSFRKMGGPGPEIPENRPPGRRTTGCPGTMWRHLVGVAKIDTPRGASPPGRTPPPGGVAGKISGRARKFRGSEISEVGNHRGSRCRMLYLNHRAQRIGLRSILNYLVKSRGRSVGRESYRYIGDSDNRITRKNRQGRIPEH